MSKFKKYCYFIFFMGFGLHIQAQETIIQYLSGKDKDNTVQWEFMVTAGRKSGQWSTIPVPSCWEMQGFGTYNYHKDITNPEEKGFYKYKFILDPAHKGKKIFIVFEASMTDTEVKINGKSAGVIHQGGFYEFKYDITNLVQFTEKNLLEVSVSKKSSNNSINRAERESDFWLFGGIFRPVYLQIMPSTFIERVAIDAKANGDFRMQVFSNVNAQQVTDIKVNELKGAPVPGSIQLKNRDSVLEHHFRDIKAWNPEHPYLYEAIVSIREGNRIIHTIKQRFGFRTTELKADGFYVNDKKIIFKGVNRHSQWPTSGRTLSRAVHLLDISTIKGMNMNAVRMSHYPPDKEFLDLCDSLGLFVIDELTGWQKAYDTISAKRIVREVVLRDRNHPSVVMWANGNEGGWNTAVDFDYARYDLQRRIVIHPWQRFRGTNTKHYPDFKYIQDEIANPKEVFFPTEFMHGLYDGGHAAALEDFWNELMKHPFNAGAFLWALHDEGVVRGDWNDSIDVAGNLAPDGIVGPHREKEASYYTIKELWSPIFIESNQLVKGYNGRVEVENRYLFTNLNKCKIEWKLVSLPMPNETNLNPKTISTGLIEFSPVEPGRKGSFDLPGNTLNAEAIYLTAFNWNNDTVCTWSWSLKKPAEIIKPLLTIHKSRAARVEESENMYEVSCDGIQYFFDRRTGLMQKVFNGKNNISLDKGPVIAGGKQTLIDFTTYQQDFASILQIDYDSLRVKWTFESGQLPKLEYAYLAKDTTDFAGISFNYPEEKIKSMKWKGRGPYRVWKNRMKGQQFGVWQKEYNNTITGQDWIYPEFKGWHSELNWVRVETTESDFTVFTDHDNIFLQMLVPGKPKAAGNDNTSPPFPEASLGFMHSIAPIGTKFQKPALLGPQSQKNINPQNSWLKGTLYFDFR